MSNGRTETTFTHVNYTETNHDHKYSDSTGIERQFNFDFQHSITQATSTYEVISMQAYMAVGKNLLNPHMEKLKTVMNRIMGIAFQNSDSDAAIINENYVKSALKMKNLYTNLMSRLSVFNEVDTDKISHELVLTVLKACEQDIELAMEDGVFAQHQEFARTTPILRSLYEFMDILKNFFAFLDKKIGKTLSGDNTPVFANPEEFSAAMFKPEKTDSEAELDKLKADIQWYCREIESEYTRCSEVATFTVSV